MDHIHFEVDKMEKMLTSKGKRKRSDGDKKEKAVWSDRMVEIFVKICVQEVQAGNRPTTHLDKRGWKNLQSKFNFLAKKEYKKKQFKNKWNSLKKDWQLWKTLIEKETGLEWDADKNTINASDDWWDRKIKEIPAVARFREKGLLFSNEMDLIFGGVVATGGQGCAPSSNLMLDFGGAAGQGPEEHDLDSEGSGDSDDIQLDPFPLAVLPLGTPIETSTDTQSEEARAKGRGKRNVKLSSGAVNFKKKQSPSEQVLVSLEKLAQIVDGHKSRTQEKEENYDCKRCVNIIKSLPIEKGSKFFFDCMKLITDNKEVRKMLVVMEEPEDQLGYLQRMAADI